MGAGVRRGFSLIELLVVIGVMGVLVGLTLSAVQQARESSSRAGCLNNLKQIGLALHSFHNLHRQFPPLPVSNTAGSDPNAYLSWMALILPEMDQQDLYAISAQACRIDRNPLNNPPHLGFATVIPTYVCPDDDRSMMALTDSSGVRAAFASYIGIAGAVPPGAARGFAGSLGVIPGCRVGQITDGTSQTVMVGERPPPDSLQAGWWYPIYWAYKDGEQGPNNTLILGETKTYGAATRCATKGTFGPGRPDNPCDRFHLWSYHPGGGNFLFADGSARFLSYSAEPLMFALASRNGGEILGVPE